MIAPHILVLSSFLSIMWGIYLANTVADYVRIRTVEGRRRGDTVTALTRVVVAICVFSLPFSFVFRTACVLLGMGDDTAAQITFFALVGPNVVGSIFAVVSLRFDG